MQTVEDLLKEVRQALSNYAYYVRYETLSRGTHHGKIRLIIHKDLFVQVNRNEAASLTNFALIHRSQRLYGRDEYRGIWHRHPLSEPEHHNSSSEGSQPISLTEFLAEVDNLLHAEGLI